MIQTGNVIAVILAAGRSSRMGRVKQVESVDGVPMVIRAVTMALQSAVTRVVVVTGAYAADVETILQPLSQEHPSRLGLLFNAEWATGQAGSVRCAVAALSKMSEALLFLPVDQPFVPVDLLQQLIQAWQQGAPLVAPVIEDKVRGAPAIFDRLLFPELLQLTGDVGARPLLQKHQTELVPVPAEAAWLRDIDTPEDLARTSEIPPTKHDTG